MRMMLLSTAVLLAADSDLGAPASVQTSAAAPSAPTEPLAPHPQPEPHMPAPTEPPKVAPTPAAAAPPTVPTGSGTATAPRPAVTVGDTVLVRETGHADSPCIVTKVTNALVSGNVFRGTHILHTAENLAEIDPSNTTGQGWFWRPRA